MRGAPSLSHEPCRSRGECYHVKGGRAQGLRNVESGHFSRIRRRGFTSAESRKGAAARNLDRAVNERTGKLLRKWCVEHPNPAARRLGGLRAAQSNHLIDTKPELAVKSRLDELQTAKAISGYTHPYNLNDKFIVDFYVSDTNTIIEVDGCYWHKCPECGHGNGKPGDRARNAYIKACGYNLEIIREHELEGYRAR